ncbi:MAG: bifunctional folylpolyglutamate synthase/dihydrofolate synthase [Clostridia bacterium]|nr:bifunctional folylpolyglutamate synthase/dihydrofolate synthase [Clostridia bacterium]
MNYKETLEYIENLQSLGSKPGLSRVTELAKLMKNPQNDLKIIHVTGTNGKGSTCAMIESVLVKAGYKVGKFSSPWIEKINEYIYINGTPLSDEDFANAMSAAKEFADKMEDHPTEFEVVTVAAYNWFKLQKCDIVIMETGMGGIGDATNIIENPVVSIITNVAMDHTKFLGETVEEIAENKAGIIKENCPVLFGGEDEKALKVIEKIAAERKAELFTTDKPDVKSSGIRGSKFEYRGLDLEIPLAGEYQPQNAATAFDALDILASVGFEISDEDIISGFLAVKWKGRFEILSENPLFIFDGGHNIHGILYAALSIKKYFGEKVNVLTGVLADKEYARMADILSPLAENVFTVTPDNPRALSAEKYAEVFHSKGVSAIACETVSEGVKKALELSAKENRPLIAIGSLYMYKDVKKAVAYEL